MEPVPATAYAIAARHRIPPDQVHPLPRGGANHVLALGPDLVLRIPRTAELAADLRKEAALIPIAHRAGVRTPALVDFTDPSAPTAPPGPADAPEPLDRLPYLLIERAPGTDLAQHAPHTHRAPAPQLLAQVGRQLALIHRIPTTELPDLPREHTPTDPAPLLNHLHRRGHLDAETTRWLRSCCAHLAALQPSLSAPVLVHGDLAPQNLLVMHPPHDAHEPHQAGRATSNHGETCDSDNEPPAELSALVDWGDAALADPATDFAKLPPHWLPPVLAGYRRQRHEPADHPHPWEARILWHHLIWALGRLADPTPRPQERHWSAPPTSRLLGLLRLFTSRPPAPWPDLAPPLPPTAPGMG